MSLSSLGLDAFLAVARTRSFSDAAKELHISQSALSQRVHQLELELEERVLERSAREVELTAAGERLLTYCLQREALESECVGDLKGSSATELKGTLRIAGYSTVLRPLVVPALAPFLRQHPDILVELNFLELRELRGFLLHGNCDFAFTEGAIEHTDVVSEALGYERFRLVEGTSFTVPQDVYIDHDRHDLTTIRYLAAQTKTLPQVRRRHFFDDVYGVLDAVRQGLGRAALPDHLLAGLSDVRVLPGYEVLELPVVLNYRRQAHHSRLHRTTMELLTAAVREALTPAGPPRSAQR